jgi:hypothetical protein
MGTHEMCIFKRGLKQGDEEIDEMFALVSDHIESITQEFDPDGVRSKQERSSTMIGITDGFVRRSIGHL